jgi:hypothetical protein
MGMLVPRLIILVWLTTFVLFDSIKFELICSFDKHAVDFMISAPVAEHQLNSIGTSPLGWQVKKFTVKTGMVCEDTRGSFTFLLFFVLK